MSSDLCTILVKQHTKMNTVMEFIEKQILNSEIKIILIQGESYAVNKVISISEILKRKYPDIPQSQELSESQRLPNEPLYCVTLKKP